MLKNYKTFDLLVKYLSYLSTIKGRSINTIIEYRTDILMFLEHLRNKRDLPYSKYDLSFVDKDFLRSISLNDMYAFIAYCQTENNASAEMER